MSNQDSPHSNHSRSQLQPYLLKMVLQQTAVQSPHLFKEIRKQKGIERELEGMLFYTYKLLITVNPTFKLSMAS